MIELAQGEELALTTADEQPLTRLRLGVSWDKDTTAGFIGTGAPEIDLDATALQFAGTQLFDVAFYNNLATRDGSVVHQGDNRSGSGEGDDEVIEVDLTKVYAGVDTIFFMVSSYQGHGLEWVDRAHCRLTDHEGHDIADVNVDAGVPETGLAVAKLVRDGDGWRIHAIGRGIAVRRPTDSLEALQPYL